MYFIGINIRITVIHNAKCGEAGKKTPKNLAFFYFLFRLLILLLFVDVVVIASSVLFFYFIIQLCWFFSCLFDCCCSCLRVYLFLCITFNSICCFRFFFHPVSSKSAFANVNKHSLTMCVRVSVSVRMNAYVIAYYLPICMGCTRKYRVVVRGVVVVVFFLKSCFLFGPPKFHVTATSSMTFAINNTVTRASATNRQRANCTIE